MGWKLDVLMKSQGNIRAVPSESAFFYRQIYDKVTLPWVYLPMAFSFAIPC